VWFGVADQAASAARRFISGDAYRAIVFGRSAQQIHAESSSPESYDWIYGAGSTLLALAGAAFGLWGRSWGGGFVLRIGSALVRPVQRLHTGRIGDYTAALTLGLGVLGGLLTLTLR
jgi:hypothetical protein